MSRRRYRVIDGEMVEVTNTPEPAKPVDSGALWGDASYRGLSAPDGTDISTRTKHRAYMRERGLTTVDDYANQFQEQARERAKLFQGAPDPQRAHDIARAWEQWRNRRG